MIEADRWVVSFRDLSARDVGLVGGKNASLGEMLRHLAPKHIAVPDGFATTADAYWELLRAENLRERIATQLIELERGDVSLKKAGSAIRRWIREAPFPDAVAQQIRTAYRNLGAQTGRSNPAVAVRSSATAEDLPEASFAGQQESFLNIRGEDEVLEACQHCMASLFTDRAITYRERHGFDHMKVALSVGIQLMVRSDKAGAGTMFSLETETGFPRAVVIDANWGLGETVVQGKVDPDQYVIFKPLLSESGVTPIVHKTIGGKERKLVYSNRGTKPTRMVKTSRKARSRSVLTDRDILKLARWAVEIERHYGCPMDIEWAQDGESGVMYVVQARPETVQSRRAVHTLRTYRIPHPGEVLVSGLSVGDAVAVGPVRKLTDPEDRDHFPDDAVLVARTTDPDWLPIMKRAAAIVTDRGGRTSHAAIVSRELGIPAVIGTGGATRVLRNGRQVTVSCAEGDEGRVYKGELEFEATEIGLDNIPTTQTRIMLNAADPSAMLRWWKLPADGVGLARIEFIISNLIRVHPLALTRFDRVRGRKTREAIEQLTERYDTKQEYFVDELASGIARIAMVQYPKPVVVRTSDFKSNEYAALLGGAVFEPREENPMLGWRGASRYYHPDYEDGFELECRAIRKVREEMGLTNVVVMIPFCRTLAEADRTLETMAKYGVRRGADALEVYVMCEIPSNVILAREFAERFDGFSIGSNDLTQLTLGIDRDSERLASLFDEENPAVRAMISTVIEAAHERGSTVGFCGQAPSDRPEFARFLVGAGIDSISVTPDSFLRVKQQVAAAETESAKTRAKTDESSPRSLTTTTT